MSGNGGLQAVKSQASCRNRDRSPDQGLCQAQELCQTQREHRQAQDVCLSV